MAKAYSLLSWNVEHFKKDPKRKERIPQVVALLKQQNPDVFALYEVEGKEVFAELTATMPGYSFHITEGPEVQEILVGVRSAFTSFFTQKLEFQAGASLMRPGALVTLTIADKHYPILFLHTASGDDPRGLGLRDDMLVRACEFRAVLDAAAGAAVAGKAAPANYLFLGDFNTMGMTYHYVSARNIAPADELGKLAREAAARKMRFLAKSAPHTWTNGSASKIPRGNLDHVVAADHMKFRSFGGAEVDVRGWPQLATAAEQDKWVRDYSDHAMLYLEVQRA